MKISQNILNALSCNSSYNLKQVFGHPFVNFRISHVGETFENLIYEESVDVLPSFETLYINFKSKRFQQFTDQKVSEGAIKGRVARMWASLIREWYAYYRIKEIFEDTNLNANVIRNDELDTFKGVDVYIMNINDLQKSIKIDILQETKRAKTFRSIKDNYRKKDQDVPGINERIYLGSDSNSTKKVPDVNGHEWYLISDEEIKKLVTRFEEISALV
jgi:hypothetical protein